MSHTRFIKRFNAIHGNVVTKQSLESFLSEVKKYIHDKKLDSHGPVGEKMIEIRDRVSKAVSLVNGSPVRLKINPKVKVPVVKNKTLEGTYEQYKISNDKFNKLLNDLTDKLNSFPKHPNGLVKDRTPEYINIKKEYDRAFQSYRKFNSLPENKKFSKKFFEEKRAKQLLIAKKRNFKHKKRGKNLSGNFKLKASSSKYKYSPAQRKAFEKFFGLTLKEINEREWWNEQLSKGLKSLEDYKNSELHKKIMYKGVSDLDKVFEERPGTGKKLSGINSIIGKTKSGKKVYADKPANEYKDFTVQDHTDAESLHVKASHRNRDKSLLYKGSAKTTAEHLREKHRKLSLEHQKERFKNLSGKKLKLLKPVSKIEINTKKIKGVVVYVKGKNAFFSSNETLKRVNENPEGLTYEFQLLHWKADPRMWRALQSYYQKNFDDKKELIHKKAEAARRDYRNMKAGSRIPPKTNENLSGVNYKYHEVDLGPYKKDYHRMYSDSVVQLHGLPGHGKTVHIMKHAQDRASRLNEHVLYVAREEFGRSEFDIKIKEQKIGHKNLRFRGNLDENDLKWANVVVLDSVTSLELTPEKIEKLLNKFPNRNWFLILQSTKDGKFRGSQQWEHLVTIAGEIRNRKLILSKNRLDPDNKDKAAKLRMDELVNEKTESMRIRERAKYEATKHKTGEL